MNISEVKQNLGEIVYLKLPNSSKLTPFIFNAYIFKVHPKNKSKRLYQAELIDTKSNCNNGSVVIANLDDIIVE